MPPSIRGSVSDPMTALPQPASEPKEAVPTAAVQPSPVSEPVMLDETASRWQLVFRRVVRRRRAMFGLTVVVLLFAVAYLSPFFVRWQYNQLDTSAFLSPPNAEHWFGTTQNGFDMFALTMRGMQKSLIIGMLGALMSTMLAATVGAFAGYFGGRLNTVLMVLVDLLLVLPGFLIIAILSPLFRERTWLLFVLLLAAFHWMITARIVRGLTLSLKEREYVLAARYMGVPGWRIIFRHILPNMSSLLIIDATVNVSALILAEVGLSFFGFGVQPPDVSLGTLIGNYAGAALTYPWEFYFPAGFLVILVLSINLLGDGLRDALDPNTQSRSGH
jgi:peptide/nickel transport system permease protein